MIQISSEQLQGLTPVPHDGDRPLFHPYQAIRLATGTLGLLFSRKNALDSEVVQYLCFNYSLFFPGLTPAQDGDRFVLGHTCVSVGIYDAEFFFVLLVSNEKIIPATQSTPPKMYAF